MRPTSGGPPSPIEETWLTHCAELRDRVTAAASDGRLTFTQGSERAQIDDPEALATVLLSSYIHMTNNRLGVAILDEIYISYLIQQLLERRAGVPAPGPPVSRPTARRTG